MNYADDYYDYNGYGWGENHDGCMLVVNMSTREWYITTCGSGINKLTDARIQEIGVAIAPKLGDGDSYGAMSAYIDKVESYL